MKRSMLAIGVALVASGALGQNSVPDDVVNELTTDLSEIYEIQEKFEAMQLANSSLKDLNSLFNAKVSNSDAFLRAGASLDSKPIGSVAEGQIFKVLDKVGELYAVEPLVDSGESGWIPASDIRLIGASHTGSDEELGWLTRQLIDKAVQLKDKYESNQYLSINGFSLTLSVPPALNLDFEFK